LKKIIKQNFNNTTTMSKKNKTQTETETETKNLQIKCNHRWECGCGKLSCVEMGLEDCQDEDVCQELCENEQCRHYYDHRNDNCDCDSKECPYCKEIPSRPVKEKANTMVYTVSAFGGLKFNHEMDAITFNNEMDAVKKAEEWKEIDYDKQITCIVVTKHDADGEEEERVYDWYFDSEAFYTLTMYEAS